MSRDGGTTWNHLTGHGLPETRMGKIAVAVARSNSNRVYALIETADPGLWRSENGGETWKLVNQDHTLLERPHYYTRLAVAQIEELVTKDVAAFNAMLKEKGILNVVAKLP